MTLLLGLLLSVILTLAVAAIQTETLTEIVEPVLIPARVAEIETYFRNQS